MVFLLLTFISTMGVIASVGCHILGWLRIDPPSGKRVFALHFAIMALWFVMIISGAIHSTPEPRERSSFGVILDSFPQWTRTGLFALFAYAFIHFIFFLFQTRGRSAHRLPLYVQVRGASGHWMVFYAAATLGFFALYRVTIQ